MKIFNDQPVPPDAILLTYAQVARMLQVSERTVWTMVQQGKLRKVPVGRQNRIAREAVERYVKGAA